MILQCFAACMHSSSARIFVVLARHKQWLPISCNAGMPYRLGKIKQCATGMVSANKSHFRTPYAGGVATM